MNIIEKALKSLEYDLRLSSSDRWMYYAVDLKVWIVRQRKTHSKSTLVLIETTNIESALKVLLEVNEL